MTPSLAWRMAIPLTIGIVLVLWPVPPGLTPETWRFVALFVAVIAGVITEPLPGAAVGLLGVALAAVLGLVGETPAASLRWALGGFANSIVWLIFAAYMFTLGYAKTGLGRRIALHLIRLMGASTIGLGYAIALADLTLAPFTPSASARSGGTIYPIIRHIPELYGSRPFDASARRIGAYLLYTAVTISMVTSSMFITALAPNALVISLVGEILDVSIPWLDWFTWFAPVGVTLLVLVPILLYKIYPPGVTRAPEAPVWAAQQLEAMGPVTRHEVLLLLLVTAALTAWIGAAAYADPALVAIVVVVLMIVLGIVSWDDVIGHAQAWNVFVWFATLVTLAGGLVETRFVGWLGQSIAPTLSGLNVYGTILGLLGAFFFLHYFFASITAHTAALFPVFLGIALAVPDVSPVGWALLLGCSLGLTGILTPYGSGQSAIYAASGYITRREFWLLGLVMGVVFFSVYAAMIVPWLRFLGY